MYFNDGWFRKCLCEQFYSCLKQLFISNNSWNNVLPFEIYIYFNEITNYAFFFFLNMIVFIYPIYSH